MCFLSGHNMVKDITVVDTNYSEYALVIKHKVFNREYTQVALYGEEHTQICTLCCYTSFVWVWAPLRGRCRPSIRFCLVSLQAVLRELGLKSSRSLKLLLCPVVSPESPFWLHLQQVNENTDSWDGPAEVDLFLSHLFSPTDNCPPSGTGR